MAKRGEFGAQWWSQRWLAALERAGWASRLQRGRSYARAGRVLELRVEKGLLRARVQGSRRRPYRVAVRVLQLDDSSWAAALAALAQRAGNAAELLSGRMPESVEGAFAAAGARLFPEELQAACSCPDWAVPCKHVAAVCYRFGALLDGDPFLLLQLRGRGRQEVLAQLERIWSGGGAGRPAGVRQERPPAVDPSAFWLPGEAAVDADGPPLGLPEALPEPGWWRGRMPLRELLRQVYDLTAAFCARVDEAAPADGTPAREG